MISRRYAFRARRKLAEDLEKLAGERGERLSDVIRRLLELGLDQYEKQDIRR